MKRGLKTTFWMDFALKNVKTWGHIRIYRSVRLYLRRAGTCAPPLKRPVSAAAHGWPPYGALNINFPIFFQFGVDKSCRRVYITYKSSRKYP